MLANMKVKWANRLHLCCCDQSGSEVCFRVDQVLLQKENVLANAVLRAENKYITFLHC